MTALVWDTPEEINYEKGVEKGVIYTATQDFEIWSTPSIFWKSAAWSGLVSVTESDPDAGVTEVFLDGRKTFNQRNRGEYACEISAFSIPKEFASIAGYASPRPGFILTGQPRSRFHFSYQTRVNKNDYKIHLVYNASLVTSSFGSETISDTVTPNVLSWSVSTMPPFPESPGFSVSSHFVLDSRKVNPDLMPIIHEVLYGAEGTAPWMPPPWVILNPTP